MGDFLLALDQGTTSSRAVLADRAGRIVAMAQEELPQYYPHPGWVEHDPLEIWETQRIAADRVVQESGREWIDVEAIGITNQRETTLLWETATGRPLHRALVWQDRRTAARCEAIQGTDLATEIQHRTGLLADPYFSATKLEYLLNQYDPERGAAESGELRFGTVDTWLLNQLTQGESHYTDRTNASRTMLYNLREERWDETLMDEFWVPISILPEVSSSTSHVGLTQVFGGVEISIFGIAGDQQAALFGQAGWSPGLAKNTYGTGCFLLLNTGNVAPPPPAGLLTTAACAADGGEGYAIEGSVFVAGAAIQWLRDGLGLITRADESEALAESVPDTAGVFVVPAFTGLGAPYWEPNARGIITGITRGATRAHIVRATLESIAHQTCDLVDTIERSGVKIEALRVDGGACANDFLMQFQADLLGISVERARIRETTALGAAYLTGIGCGWWKSSDLEQLWSADRVFHPSLDEGARGAMRDGWNRAVARARG